MQSTMKARLLCIVIPTAEILWAVLLLLPYKILREDDIINKAQIRAQYLNNKLREKLENHKNIGEIRNIGLINAMELVTDKKTKEGFDSKLRMGYQIYKHAL